MRVCILYSLPQKEAAGGNNEYQTSFVKKEEICVMATYFEETLKNGEAYFMSSNYNNAAKMFGEKGFTGKQCTKDRTYYVTCRIDKDTEFVIIEVSPCIFCDDSYRGQASEYISQINAMHKTGNFRLDDNGHVYVQIESSFKDGAISSDGFDEMVKMVVSISDTFEKIIDKLCHGRLISLEETAGNAVKARARRLVVSITESTGKNDHNGLFGLERFGLSKLTDDFPCFDENDDDEFDDTEFMDMLKEYCGGLSERKTSEGKRPDNRINDILNALNEDDSDNSDGD